MTKLENISIVLVHPQNPGNIGSVLRAMGNGGLTHLVLVDPCDLNNPELKKMAVGDLSILGKAKIYSDLKEALKPFRWTIATTRRHRRRFNQTLSPREVVEKIKGVHSQSKIAIVFGPEDKGLENAELALCQNLSTIPSHAHFPSLNLAQAVMIYSYEIYRARIEKFQSKSEDFVGMKALEGMYGHLEKTLFQIGYFTRGKPERLMESIRNFLGRALLSARDIRILRGICSTIERKLKVKS
ncbi:MAG: RNA methyltransferase [Chlamydiae bacterium]|nr:RNA methyltransferase [Chlamydiota bacterium]MBI3276384.1 RNA methyltransferase [Chlamydiota bacterium]